MSCHLFGNTTVYKFLLSRAYFIIYNRKQLVVVFFWTPGIYGDGTSQNVKREEVQLRNEVPLEFIRKKTMTYYTSYTTKISFNNIRQSWQVLSPCGQHKPATTCVTRVDSLLDRVKHLS